MTFINNKGSNNAKTLFQSSIANGALSLQCTEDEGDLFPSTFPFPLVLEAYNTDTIPKVVKREIVKVTNRVDDIFTIVRGDGTCVQDDTATPKVQGNTAYSFDAGDSISLYITNEDVKDIKDEVARLETDKLDIDDYQNGLKVYAASSTGNDSYAITLSPAPASYLSSQVFRFQADVSNTGAASLNVNGLGAKTIKKLHDQDLASGDIEAGQIVTVAYDGTNFQMDSQIATIPTIDITSMTTRKPNGSDPLPFYSSTDVANGKAIFNSFLRMAGYFGDGSDGDVTISGTVTLSRDMYYENLAVPSGQILDPAGYRIFVRGTLSGTGTIRRNGNNASGITAGAALGQGSLNAEVAGSNGATAVNNSAGVNGTAGTSSNPSMTNTNGVAGGGGGGYTGATGASTGGAAGTSTRGGNYNRALKLFSMLMHGATVQSIASYIESYKSVASSGSGGAGGGTGSTGGNGGGAGGNGGFIRICAWEWNFTGTVSQTGGSGGNGGNGAGNSGGGGGGGGGQGGITLRIYAILTADCTFTQTGGSGGTGGTLAGTGSNGSNGTAGNTGSTVSIAL